MSSNPVQLKLICDSLRKQNPPYICPIGQCDREYRTFSGIQFHIFNSRHTSVAVAAAGEKLRSPRKNRVNTPIRNKTQSPRSPAKKQELQALQNSLQSEHEEEEGVVQPLQRIRSPQQKLQSDQRNNGSTEEVFKVQQRLRSPQSQRRLQAQSETQPRLRSPQQQQNPAHDAKQNPKQVGDGQQMSPQQQLSQQQLPKHKVPTMPQPHEASTVAGNHSVLQSQAAAKATNSKFRLSEPAKGQGSGQSTSQIGRIASPAGSGAGQQQPREGLTYAEAQKVVEIEVEGGLYRLNIEEPLNIVLSSERNDSTPEGARQPDKFKSPQKSGKGKRSRPSKAAKGKAKDQTDAQPRLPEAIVEKMEDYECADAPERPSSYYRFIEKSAEELDEMVEYDMDEEDCAWLEIMNKKRKKQGIPHDVSGDTFEFLMDRLEKESYFQAQNTPSATVGSAIDDDAVCCICQDGECHNANAILFCDMCNLAVHQECYGVPYIPEGQWLCRRCLQSPSRAVDCVLCPNRGGAFKQTSDGKWGHVVCALWVPEVYFANTVFLEPIDNICNIPAARWKLTCYICKKRGQGACIQCHKANCYTAFHVTCAQQAGLYMKLEECRNGEQTGVRKTAFCDTHAPVSYKKADKMRSARKILQEKAKALPIVSIPTIPAERISHISSLVDIPKKADFVKRLMGYWTLKRQSRNGVSLLRRLQMSHLSRNNKSDIDMDSATSALRDQLKYWQRLRQDLERARLLCELIRKREKLKREFLKLRERVFLTEISPLVKVLNELINLLQETDPEDIFAKPVDPNEVPDYLTYIKEPMDFQTMRTKVNNLDYRSFAEFEKDFQQIVTNCMTYNAKETLFYEAAIILRDEGGQIIREHREYLSTNFDYSTGRLKPLPRSTPSQKPVPHGIKSEPSRRNQSSSNRETHRTSSLSGRGSRVQNSENDSITRWLSPECANLPIGELLKSDEYVSLNTEDQLNVLLCRQQKLSRDEASPTKTKLQRMVRAEIIKLRKKLAAAKDERPPMKQIKKEPEEDSIAAASIAATPAAEDEESDTESDSTVETDSSPTEPSTCKTVAGSAATSTASNHNGNQEPQKESFKVYRDKGSDDEEDDEANDEEDANSEDVEEDEEDEEEEGDGEVASEDDHDEENSDDASTAQSSTTNAGSVDEQSEVGGVEEENDDDDDNEEQEDVEGEGEEEEDEDDENDEDGSGQQDAPSTVPQQRRRGQRSGMKVASNEVPLTEKTAIESDEERDEEEDDDEDEDGEVDEDQEEDDEEEEGEEDEEQEEEDEENVAIEDGQDEEENAAEGNGNDEEGLDEAEEEEEDDDDDDQEDDGQHDGQDDVESSAPEGRSSSRDGDVDDGEDGDEDDDAVVNDDGQLGSVATVRRGKSAAKAKRKSISGRKKLIVPDKGSNPSGPRTRRGTNSENGTVSKPTKSNASSQKPQAKRGRASSGSSSVAEELDEQKLYNIPLEPLDLVWAKCRGYPWYPALIIDPDVDPAGETSSSGGHDQKSALAGVSIPTPPPQVLQLRPKERDPRHLPANGNNNNNNSSSSSINNLNGNSSSVYTAGGHHHNSTNNNNSISSSSGGGDGSSNSSNNQNNVNVNGLSQQQQQQHNSSCSSSSSNSSCNSQNVRDHHQQMFLVLFFDAKRTWQWLPRSKLVPLGPDADTDKRKLQESRKPAERKAVKKAYEDAIAHRCRVAQANGESPIS